MRDTAEVASGLSRMDMSSSEVPLSGSLQHRPQPQPQVAPVAPVLRLNSPARRSLVDMEDICCPITQVCRPSQLVVFLVSMSP